MSLLQCSLDELELSLSATAEGDFSHRIDMALPGDLGALKQAVYQSLDALEQAFGDISATTGALAQGDLTRRMRGNDAGTLRELAQSLNASLDSLSRVIAEVAETAADVGLGGQRDRGRQRRSLGTHRTPGSGAGAAYGEHHRPARIVPAIGREQSADQRAHPQRLAQLARWCRGGGQGRPVDDADQQLEQADRRHHRADRLGGLPDQPAGPERGGGGGACRRLRPRICGGCRRGAQFGAPRPRPRTFAT
ncbi:methyl-accepting chemotaxis protein [Xanthomonas theicola]|nr:methyl-accepting chemotaxis protein [Xanthomonas theicola]QNH25129.1 methyl-accepting chemotaxis protein [Xanthomonas theicola]